MPACQLCAPPMRRIRRCELEVVSPGGVVALFVHVWIRRRLQAFFDDIETVCMHVYRLRSKHARSLDEIRTPSPQQIGGSSPKGAAGTKIGLQGVGPTSFVITSESFANQCRGNPPLPVSGMLAGERVRSVHCGARVLGHVPTPQHLDHPRILVGKRHGRSVIAASSDQFLEPLALRIRLADRVA